MSLSRREFCTVVGAAALATTAVPVWSSDFKPFPLRVIAYNILVNRGWPSNRPLAQRARSAGQMPRRLAMELALYEPDIVTFCESPSEQVVREIAEHLEMNYTYIPSGQHWPGSVLSRFDIGELQTAPMIGERPEELFTRHWGRVTFDLPNGESLILHSMHLRAGGDFAPVRQREIAAILESAKPDLDAGRSLIFMGDCNHKPDSKEYQLWMEAGCVDTLAQVGDKEALTYPAHKPDRRIDYVFAAGPITKTIRESKPLFENNYRLNLADDQSFALSDHLPQMTVFGPEPE